MSGNKWQNINADSGEKTWLTPKHVIDALGHFDTDPCCPPNMPWRTADRMLTKEDDGTTAPWIGRVWLNPPYGKEAWPFLERMAHYEGGGGYRAYFRADGRYAVAQMDISSRSLHSFPSRTNQVLPRGRNGQRTNGSFAFRAHRVFARRHGRACQKRTARNACEVEMNNRKEPTKCES